jgi:hypothetical protein
LKVRPLPDGRLEMLPVHWLPAGVWASVVVMSDIPVPLIVNSTWLMSSIVSAEAATRSQRGYDESHGEREDLTVCGLIH